ncbi:MAG: hypothetical protein A2107_01230 [Verrucomicrobia bacterium GWF2_62_7]|nr:MAG: hypothetical protein A2107_01230 [Verrucomicrobia bacterium GWF2_62_7]
MKILGKFLLVTLCVTALSFGAIIDNFQVNDLTGASDTTIGGTVVGAPVAIPGSSRFLFADKTGIGSLALVGQVADGVFAGSAASNVTGYTGAIYTGLWNLTAAGSYMDIELMGKDSNPGTIEFGIQDITNSYLWSAPQALNALGVYSTSVAFANSLDLSQVTYLAFRINHGSDLDVTLDNFRTGVIPEPGTYAMMALGLLGVFAARRKKA